VPAESDPADFVVLGVDDAGPGDGADDFVEANPPPGRLARRVAAVLSERRWRWMIAGTAFAAIGTAAMVREDISQHDLAVTPLVRAAASSTTPSPQTGPASSTSPQWPQALGACGERALLPIVSAVPLREKTGLQLIVGDQLRTVDVDSGKVEPVAGFTLAPDEVISQLATEGSDTYALIARCRPTDTGRVIRIGPRGVPRTVASGHIHALLTGGSHVWAVSVTSSNNRAVSVDPLNGEPPLTLPVDFYPAGAYGDLLAGSQDAPPDSAPSQLLVLLDPKTRTVRSTLGRGGPIVVGAGLTLWSDASCQARGPCPVYERDLASGRTSSHYYPLPADFYFSNGVISKDRRLLAFQLPRTTPDPRFTGDHPRPPADIAVLQLDTGALDVVPGIELRAESSVGLAFSADGRWLVVALNEGTHTRLLVWRHGLAHPMEPSVTLPGPVLSSPPVTLRGR